jgi:hypothetical protein
MLVFQSPEVGGNHKARGREPRDRTDDLFSGAPNGEDIGERTGGIAKLVPITHTPLKTDRVDSFDHFANGDVFSAD